MLGCFCPLIGNTVGLFDVDDVRSKLGNSKVLGRVDDFTDGGCAFNGNGCAGVVL